MQWLALIVAGAQAKCYSTKVEVSDR